jgi:hypothetical protein
MTLETSVGQPLLIAAFIDCSPLGLYCRDCEVAFISNKSAEQHIRSIHRNAMNSTNRKAVIKLFEELRANGNGCSLEEWLVGEPKNGGECSVCREFIPLRKHFKRHTDKNEACVSAFCTIRMFRRTRCFRNVPIYDDQQSTISSLSTVTAFAFDPPTIAALSTNSPTDTTTTTTNATTTTSQLGLSMREAINSIRPFVRPDEDASIWAPWFSGLAGRSPSLKDTLLGLVELWKAPVEEDKEPTLYRFLEVAERWLIDYSHIHIKQVPANFRNRLAVFESHEFGNTKYRGCFEPRQVEGKYRDEFFLLLRYAWRYSDSMLLASIKTEFELVQSGNVMTVLELGIVPRFVNTIHLEKATSVQQSTLLLDYVLSRCFHIDSALELKMVECSNAGSRMASVLHICRMGLCGEIMLLSGGDGYEHTANKLVSISRDCKNVNIICPMISDTRRMAMQKPNSLRAAVDPATGAKSKGTSEFGVGSCPGR